MISIKPRLLNVSHSIRDNLDPDSKGGKESNSHKEKPFASKNTADEGTVIQFVPISTYFQSQMI
jgi:hypothetical protein